MFISLICFARSNMPNSNHIFNNRNKFKDTWVCIDLLQRLLQTRLLRLVRITKLFVCRVNRYSFNAHVMNKSQFMYDKDDFTMQLRRQLLIIHFPSLIWSNIIIAISWIKATDDLCIKTFQFYIIKSTIHLRWIPHCLYDLYGCKTNCILHLAD